MDSQGAGREGRNAEISGWDDEENFFVEKAVLQQGGASNRADLRAHLRVGSLVFVRLIQEHSMNRAVPVTYRVSSISLSTGNSRPDSRVHEVEMIELRPREAARRTLLEFTLHKMPRN